MDTNLAEFNKQLDDFSKTIPQQAIELQKKMVLEALKRIVEKTPVDTGRARGNWQVMIGTPASSVLKSTDKEGMKTIQKGLSAISDLPFGQVVYISNNLEYIEFLEEGSSQQAPAGMVSVTIEELKEMFK